jgi:hypothetical protein
MPGRVRSPQWLTEGGIDYLTVQRELHNNKKLPFSRHLFRAVSESESHSTTNHHITTARHQKQQGAKQDLFHVVAVWEPPRSGLSVTGQDPMQMELTTALLDLS